MSVLPPDAERLLKTAGAIKDESERRVAVDAAIDLIKQKYPKHFLQNVPKKEIEHETDKRKTGIPRFIRG